MGLWKGHQAPPPTGTSAEPPLSMGGPADVRNITLWSMTKPPSLVIKRRLLPVGLTQSEEPLKEGEVTWQTTRCWQTSLLGRVLPPRGRNREQPWASSNKGWVLSRTGKLGRGPWVLVRPQPQPASTWVSAWAEDPGSPHPHLLAPETRKWSICVVLSC